MANITRIKTNQISDGNVTAAKIASGTLVGSLFAPSLTLNSNVTILGNLSVGGNTSTINSVNTYIQDPIVVFNNGYTGSLTGYNMGVLVNRNYAALGPYGAVNTAWVWVESDQAFEAITTATSGNALTSLTSSGFANVKLGNTTVTSLTTAGTVSAGLFSGPISAASAGITTLVATNFSSGNILVTGGSATGLTNLASTNAGITTLVATNFSSANAQITGGSLTGDVTVQATTGQFTNFSTGNALITAAGITTGVVTNLSSGNILLTGGSATGLTNLASTNGGFTTLVATNFSTSNAQITSAGITTGVVTNLSSGNAFITNAGHTTLVSTNFSSANVQITSGSATTLVATNLSSGNVQLNGADNNGLQYTSGVLQITGGAGISGNLYVSGNVYAGNLISTTTQILEVTDPLLYLSASTPSTYNYEIGIYSHFGPTGGLGYQHTGLVRDHNDYTWKLFSNVPEPTGGTVIFTNAIYDTLKLGAITLANTTVSSSTSTGALVVSGGAGIAGQLYAAGINGTTGSIGTLVASTGFSSGNAVITSAGITTGVVTNLSSGNAVISGGSANGLTTLSATTATATNLSSGNAVITNAGFTTAVSTNFSSSNAQITSSSTTTGVVTNLSSGNAVITNAGITTGVVTNLSSGNAVITGGYITTANITTTGAAIHGGNVVAGASTATTSTTTGALVVVGGTGIAGNIIAGQSAIFNSAQGAGMDFQVKGKTDTTLIWARPNATYDTVIIGNSATASTAVSGAKLVINTTDTILLPAGTNAQRPGSAGYTDVAGMFRYSTTNNTVEWYNGTSWQTASTSFTVVVDQQFNGDGGTTDFTLSQSATTAGCIVSINGVVQIPTLAYSIVSSTTLRFTEAPATGDVIDVRLLTTTTTVTSLSSATGKAQITVDDATGITLISGTGGATPAFTIPTGGGLVTQDAGVSVASANSATTIDTVVNATYRSAKYIVQVTNGSNYQTSEALVIQNGTTATVVEYGTVRTNGNLGVLSATVSGSNTLVQFIAANATNTVKVFRQYVPV